MRWSLCPFGIPILRPKPGNRYAVDRWPAPSRPSGGQPQFLLPAIGFVPARAIGPAAARPVEPLAPTCAPHLDGAPNPVGQVPRERRFLAAPVPLESCPTTIAEWPRPAVAYFPA